MTERPPMRAAFMGSPDFAVPSLHATARTCELLLVVTQPDRPAGRGRKLQAPAVKSAALELDDGAGVEVIQPLKVRDGTLRDRLAQLDLDVIVVTAYGRILPKDILDLPRYGCINVHGSLLPRWRGAAPIQRAVLAGDAETGVSIMQMDEGCDTGPVYEMASTPIGPEETSGELFDRLAVFGGQTLERFLPTLPHHAPPSPQPESGMVHAPKLEKSEGIVRWDAPAQAVINHVRGMDPWPGAQSTFDGAPIKLFAVRKSDYVHAADTWPPGGTILALDDQGLHVACADASVCITAVQPAGKKRMAASAFAAGRRLKPGVRLGV